MHTAFEPNRSAPLDVLVIGAGQSGLALAWHLARRDLRYLLVDAAPELGHTWRGRWDSLRLFSPSQFDGLPGMPFPAAADTYPTKDQVADFLAAYAAENAFPILTGTTVTRLVRAGTGFEVDTTQGTLRARQVVVASGAFHTPYIPEVAGRFGPSVRQMHSSAYANPSRVRGRVLVVGAGNSGLQIAGELALSHRVVVAAGSRPPTLPQRFAGRDLFWWLTRLGLMDKPADSRLGRWVRARGDLVIGSSRGRLRRRGIDIRPRLVGGDGDTARFADGSQASIDSIVWATGYSPDHSWIDIPGCVVGGQVQHQEGRGTVPGLWFLGLPWQRTRGSSLLGFVQRDAAVIAEQLSVSEDLRASWSPALGGEGQVRDAAQG